MTVAVAAAPADEIATNPLHVTTNDVHKAKRPTTGHKPAKSPSETPIYVAATVGTELPNETMTVEQLTDMVHLSFSGHATDNASMVALGRRSKFQYMRAGHALSLIRTKLMAQEKWKAWQIDNASRFGTVPTINAAIDFWTKSNADDETRAAVAKCESVAEAKRYLREKAGSADAGDAGDAKTPTVRPVTPAKAETRLQAIHRSITGVIDGIESALDAETVIEETTLDKIYGEADALQLEAQRLVRALDNYSGGGKKKKRPKVKFENHRLVTT